MFFYLKVLVIVYVNVQFVIVSGVYTVYIQNTYPFIYALNDIPLISLKKS